ncbi:hypothetical protein BaRGS_00019268 [Batillaria attramentaria]|uniref:Apple domain-containing protein n=1 Tax=Batillaria attramentaria TaxID=370345 RepID=A0ABD0KQM9_9CAEN
MPGFNLVAGFLLFVLSGAHASELTVQNSSSATDVRTFDYDTCPRGAVFRDQQLTKVKTRSRLECADRCSSTVGCEAFNVCPDDLPGAFTCHLLSDRNPQGCDGLTAAPSSDCRYAAKRCPCQNGGTWNGHYCKCPVEFTGSCCERFIRDCQEAYDNGHTGTGAYRIHPIGAPSPFYVSNAHYVDTFDRSEQEMTVLTGEILEVILH